MKMNAKRIIALLLALVMVFALAACGKDDGSSETGSDSVPGTTDLTQADAEQLAKEYVTSGDGAYKILDKVESDAPRTNKISVPRIGSVDIANDTVEKSGSTCYMVTVKGTTNAYDEYGQYLARVFVSRCISAASKRLRNSAAASCIRFFPTASAFPTTALRRQALNIIAASGKRRKCTAA